MTDHQQHNPIQGTAPINTLGMNIHVGQTAKKNHAKAAQVLKPLINQLSSSINSQFRRIEHEHDKLKTKLHLNESNMHRRIWKLKSREEQDDLSNWHNKEDLRNYLTAMSLLGNSKNGGGRTFGKEKHSFFDNISHFKDTLDAARASKRENYLKKLRAAGIREHSKKGEFLWKQIQERNPDPLEKPKSNITNKKEEEKEIGGVNAGPTTLDQIAAEPDLTPEEEDALRALAREDDIQSAGQGWSSGADGPSDNDSALIAQQALLRLTASISPQQRRRAQANREGGNTNDDGTDHLGVIDPNRRAGQALTAPKQFRKSSWELEELEEERQAALEAERQRKLEAENKAKMDAEREARSKKNQEEGDRGRSRYGKQQEGGGASRRGSMININQGKGGSMITSVTNSPHGSRRNSLVNATAAFKALARRRSGGNPAAAAAALAAVNGAGDKTISVQSGKNASSAEALTEEHFVNEASRVMGMVLSNSAKFLGMSAAHKQALQAAAAAERVADGDGTSRSTETQTQRSMSARKRADEREHARNVAQEIEEWNAKTPVKRRSVNEKKGEISILQLAAEKLGVGAFNLGGPSQLSSLSRPTTGQKLGPRSAKYRESFEARSPSREREVGMNGEIYVANEPNILPPNAAHNDHMTPRARAIQTNFGHSPTSVTTNIGSINSAVEFNEHKGRKELVQLNPALNPAQIFAGIEENLGSTLMSFDQLHLTNKQLADEQRKRHEDALLAKANSNIVHSEKPKTEGEKDKDELLRDKLAAKSREREWVSRDGSTAKKLHVSSSTGHLSKKVAEELHTSPGKAKSNADKTATANAESRPTTAGSQSSTSRKRSEDTFFSSLASDAKHTGLPELTNSPSKKRIPLSNPDVYLSKSGHDYVHLDKVLILPKWDDVTKVIDYQTRLPGYVPPPPEIDPFDVPQVTTETKTDEDGFVTTVITTLLRGVATVEVVKGAPRPKPVAVLPTIQLNAPPVTGATATDPNASANAPQSGERPSTAKRRRKELEEKLMLDIDFDIFTTPSSRKQELKRLYKESQIPSPTHQGPSIFQAQKIDSFKQTYAKFLANTVDTHRIVGAISTAQPEEISGRSRGRSTAVFGGPPPIELLDERNGM